MVREEGVPGRRQEKDLLDLDKGREDADDQARGDQHDQHPDVELDGGPVVLVHTLDDAALVDHRVAGDGGRHGGGCGGVAQGSIRGWCCASGTVVVVVEGGIVRLKYSVCLLSCPDSSRGCPPSGRCSVCWCTPGQQHTVGAAVSSCTAWTAETQCNVFGALRCRSQTAQKEIRPAQVCQSRPAKRNIPESP